MKKLLTTLMFAMLTLVSIGSFCSCKESPLPPGREEIKTIVDGSIADMVNPVFYTADEVLIYQETMTSNQMIDSIFTGLPEKTLYDAASVCINKYKQADKKTIVREYLSNRDVYSNLPPNTPGDQSTTTASTEQKPIEAATNMEGSGVTGVDQPMTKVDISYNTKDTTIDGKKATVETRVKTTYE